MKNLWENYKKETIGGVILFGTLLLQLVLILFNGDNLINSESASDLVMSQLFAKNGSFVSSNWYYSSELKLLNTQLFQVPLFWITNNYNLVRAISNLGLYIAMLGSYYYMIRQLGYERKWFWYTAAILLFPISYEYYYNIGLTATYIPYISISFFIIGLYNYIFSNGKYKTVAFVGLLTLSFVSCLSGVLQLAITFIPSMITVFLLYYRTGKKQPFITVGSSIIAAGIGYIFHVKLLPNYFHFQVQPPFTIKMFSVEAIETLILQILSIVGFDYSTKVESIELLSKEGIGYVLAFALLVLVMLLIAMIWKKISKLTVKAQGIVIFSSAIFFIQVFFVLFMNNVLATYYYVFIVAWLAPMIVVYITECESEIRIRNLFLGGFIVCLVLCSAKEYYFLLKTQTNQARTGAITWIEENGYDIGYADFWNANVVTEMTDGNLTVINLHLNQEEKLDLYECLEWGPYLEENYSTKPVFLLYSSVDLRYIEFTSDRAPAYQDEHFTVCIYENSLDLITKMREE